MSLKDLNIQYEYRSDLDNLVDKFYIPCFTQSVDYRRAVGFFTSNGLALAAKGLAAFLKRSGHMRLVASPIFQPEDIKAISQGYEAKSNIIEKAILRQFSKEFLLQLSETAVARLGCLAWLIAEGYLDIKIALPSQDLIACNQAIYHEKIGIFTDNEGNAVAFIGSPNETVGGLVSNFESFDVYVSWDDPQGRVKRKELNFERLWADNTPGLEIFSFPEAVKKRLLEFKPKQRPVNDPESREYMIDEPFTVPNTGYAIPEFKPPDNLKLFPHQEAAIRAWNSTNDISKQAIRTGFLEMATGSGKTITALCIAAQLHKDLGHLAIIVVAPTKVLVDQWSEEAGKFGLTPIKAHSDFPAWKKEAWSSVRAFRRGHIDRIALIVTNASFVTPEFQAIISEIGEPTLLIADEAHNLGTERIVNCLPQYVQYRLALSATPRRYFDEEGTHLLFDYFGESVYQFTLRDAIGVCLTPYDYFIIPVELTSDEFESYSMLTAKIGKLQAIQPQSEESHERINRLYIKRAELISSAENKIEALFTALSSLELHHLKHTFVYTSDKDPEQTNMVINLLQNRMGLLIHQFTEEETRNRQLRQDLLDRFAVGNNLQVLIAKRCLDEGIDIPPTRRGYFLASSSNPRQYIQRRGRLLRKFPGKTHAVIYDFLVLPPSDSDIIGKDIGAKVIISEFRRIVEFASTARNGETARLSIMDIARRFGILDILVQGGTS